MHKISVEIDANRIVVYARGRLTGSSVSELENCWKHMSSVDTPDRIRLDLGGVTFVDKNGKALLSVKVPSCLVPTLKPAWVQAFLTPATLGLFTSCPCVRVLYVCPDP